MSSHKVPREEQVKAQVYKPSVSVVTQDACLAPRQTCGGVLMLLGEQ